MATNKIADSFERDVIVASLETIQSKLDEVNAEMEYLKNTLPGEYSRLLVILQESLNARGKYPNNGIYQTVEHIINSL